MKKKFQIILLTLSFCGLSTQAFANCNLIITSPGQTIINNYNGLETGAAHERVKINLSNTGESICRGKLGFDAENDEGFLKNHIGEQLEYKIVDNTNLNRVVYDSRLHLSLIHISEPTRPY